MLCHVMTDDLPEKVSDAIGTAVWGRSGECVFLPRKARGSRAALFYTRSYSSFCFLSAEQSNKARVLLVGKNHMLSGTTQGSCDEGADFRMEAGMVRQGKETPLPLAEQ